MQGRSGSQPEGRDRLAEGKSSEEGVKKDSESWGEEGALGGASK